MWSRGESGNEATVPIKLGDVKMCTHFHKQGTVFLKPDSLSIGKGEQFIIVHDRVHILYPQCIHIAIKENILSLILLGRSIDFSEDVGEESVGPVPCNWIQDTVELYHSNCLGIHGVELCAETKSEICTVCMCMHEQKMYINTVPAKFPQQLS